jgi:2-methylcitrate dehydratase PrpD
MVSATAIMATLLAQRGLTGPEDVIESEAGFAKSIAETLNLDMLLAPISGYKIMEVNTKWYTSDPQSCPVGYPGW